MERAGIEGIYRTFSMEESELSDFVDEMRSKRERQTPEGVNVTIPFKERIMSFLDGLSPEAREIGAVNTVGKEKGKLIGYYTDCRGFLRSLEDAGVDPSGKRALVIGSGGAARAVCYGFIGSPVSSLTIVSRNTRTGRELAESWIPGSPGVGRAFLELSDDLPGEEIEKADIIINTTPLGSGRFSDSSPLPGDSPLHAEQTVVDIVYETDSTPLLRQADSRGARTLNGLGMLVHQAIGSLEIWLDVEVDAAFVLNKL